MKIKSGILRATGVDKPYALSKPIHIETVNLEEPSRDEVLIKIKAASLCQSDLSVIKGNIPRPLPIALGHEAAGEVVKVGEGVTEFAPGDKVVCVFVPSCGHCIPCSEGRPALCEPGVKANNEGKLFTGANKITTDNENEVVRHHVGISAFSEYAVLSKNSLVKVETELPFERLALFGCAVVTGVGAVVNAGAIKLGNRVAVIGLGGVGLSALMGAIATGASEVIAIDINDQKLEEAKSLGATATFNSKDEDVVQQVLDYSNGGVDVAFETAGVVPAMNIAYHVAKRGGTVVTTGLPHHADRFPLPSMALTFEEKNIKGSYLGSCVPVRDIPRFIKLHEQGLLPVERLLSKVISLEEINEGFDLLASGSVNRIVIKMD